MPSPMPNLNVDPLNQLAEIQKFLNRCHVFSGAPGGVSKLFAYLAIKEEFSKGELILEEGRCSDRFFLIMSGEVDIHQHYNGRRFHLQLLSDSTMNYFGELALLSEFNWFFSARALTDVKLLSVSREAFVKVMERHPGSYQSMVQKIIKLRIDRFVDQSAYLLDHIAPDAWREYPLEK